MDDWGAHVRRAITGGLGGRGGAVGVPINPKDTAGGEEGVSLPWPRWCGHAIQKGDYGYMSYVMPLLGRLDLHIFARTMFLQKSPCSLAVTGSCWWIRELQLPG